MARRLFGTDGVRGVVGSDLTEELVERLGRAFARWSGGARVLVGRDTRASGPALERALAAGLSFGGSDVVLGGVLPTPAVALLAEDAGAVVSASHNPAEYNGIKFFRSGWKLEDAEEEEIEALLDDDGDAGSPGDVEEASGLIGRYVDLVCERFGAPLQGLRVVLDCANGAMAEAAPAAFERLGAESSVIGAAPTGANINDGCGATDLRLLSRVVLEEGAHLGVAFDGDGDRMLAVDERGNEVDGDQILAVLALHLGVDLVAVTQMTNLGFHRLMGEHGIRVLTTDVGDRYVLEALRAEGGVLGGEQSGHVLYLDGHVDRRRVGRRPAALPDGRRAAPLARRPGCGHAALPAGQGEHQGARQGASDELARRGRPPGRRARGSRPCARAAIGDGAGRQGACRG